MKNRYFDLAAAAERLVGAHLRIIMSTNSFWKPNITTAGRVVRALIGVVLGIAAWFQHTEHPILAVVLALLALFTFYEAWRGWCLGRACGIKTRI